MARIIEGFSDQNMCRFVEYNGRIYRICDDNSYCSKARTNLPIEVEMSPLNIKEPETVIGVFSSTITYREPKMLDEKYIDYNVSVRKKKERSVLKRSNKRRGKWGKTKKEYKMCVIMKLEEEDEEEYSCESLVEEDDSYEVLESDVSRAECFFCDWIFVMSELCYGCMFHHF